jgi:hypothetical protein
MHNASIDEDVAKAGACARVHLPTGSMCTLAAGHSSSCDFVSPDQANATLDQHKTDEGW